MINKHDPIMDFKKIRLIRFDLNPIAMTFPRHVQKRDPFSFTKRNFKLPLWLRPSPVETGRVAFWLS